MGFSVLAVELTTSESGVSNGPQYLTAGRYKLTFKVLASLGFAPKDATIKATRQVINGNNYNVYTVYITLNKKNNTSTLEGLKELLIMKANGDTSVETGTKISAGVGIGVNVIKNENTAYIENATITAGGVTVRATTGGQEITTTTTENGTNTTTYNNKSNVDSNAGYNSGKFGWLEQYPSR